MSASGARRPEEGTIFAEIVIILALIVANGIFAGAEIAVVSLRPTRLSQLVDEKRPGAATVAALRAVPERFLATIQIGITVVGTTAAAFGGSTMARHLAPLLGKLPFIGTKADDVALAIVVALVSYLSLVLGELVPKSLALRAAERYALWIARPLAALSWLAKPVVWALTASSNVLLRPFSDRTNFVEARISKEELQQMVDEAAKTGALHEDAGELASRALAFDKLVLRDVMIPRDHIDALPKNATTAQVRQFLLERRRSRFPVYEGSLDNLTGYVSAKDVVALAWEGKLVVLSDMVRPVKVFPETLAAIEVLRFMRSERLRMAVAVDEHGAVSGIVTFEDLVEELVGDVVSEHEDQRQLIALQEDGTLIVRGEAPVREVNRQADLALDEVDGAATVGGLCIQLAGGIPNRHARLAAPDGVVLVVLDASPRAVKRVQIVPPRKESPLTIA